MSMYCVYLTVYLGKKLPMFYIGSSTISKIKNGYRGSVSSKAYGNIWKNELRENPNLFKTCIISEHLTREDAFGREETIQKKLNVVNHPMYINKSFANSKFSLKQHSPWTRNLFKERTPWNKGKKLIDEIYKIGGRKNKGKKNPCAESTKQKLRVPNPLKANLGKKNGMFNKTHTDSVKAKLGSEATKRFKGKTYEELYGVERAAELKRIRSEKMKETKRLKKNLLR